MGSSSLARDRTRAPCIVSVESQPLGSPSTAVVSGFWSTILSLWLWSFRGSWVKPGAGGGGPQGVNHRCFFLSFSIPPSLSESIHLLTPDCTLLALQTWAGLSELPLPHQITGTIPSTLKCGWEFIKMIRKDDHTFNCQRNIYWWLTVQGVGGGEWNTGFFPLFHLFEEHLHDLGISDPPVCGETIGFSSVQSDCIGLLHLWLQRI